MTILVSPCIENHVATARSGGRHIVITLFGQPDESILKQERQILAERSHHFAPESAAQRIVGEAGCPDHRLAQGAVQSIVPNFSMPASTPDDLPRDTLSVDGCRGISKTPQEQESNQTQKNGYPFHWRPPAIEG